MISLNSISIDFILQSYNKISRQIVSQFKVRTIHENFVNLIQLCPLEKKLQQKPSKESLLSSSSIIVYTFSVQFNSISHPSSCHPLDPARIARLHIAIFHQKIQQCCITFTSIHPHIQANTQAMYICIHTHTRTSV